VTVPFSPQRWANTLTTVLNAAYQGRDRFPVNVPSLAQDFSRQRFPESPIARIEGARLPRFDGALLRMPEGKKGWGIIYNDAITSRGRINFTLAHEFGHYLLHREAYPDGLECGSQDMVRWDSEYAHIEQQANDFAATLLMPLDDFRRQIDPKSKPTLDEIGACAERYQVSLIAATLRWLQYTERRSVLVVSTDGFILWARSSQSAWKTGAYFKTAGRSPILIPSSSLPSRTDLLTSNKGAVAHDAGVWFREPCEEVALLSDQYEFAISLLHLGDAIARWDFDEEKEEDVFERMQRGTGC
jgi:hypothetical protein